MIHAGVAVCCVRATKQPKLTLELAHLSPGQGRVGRRDQRSNNARLIMSHTEPPMQLIWF